METLCIGGFLSGIWLAIIGLIVFRFATRGVRGVGLGAKVVVHEQLSFRAESSSTVKTDVSVVTTSRRDAPIGLAFVQRAPLSIAGSGASLTREQALAVAAWLREAAARGEPPYRA
jgi:hypothetical protein